MDLLFISLCLEESIDLIWKNSHIYWKQYVHSHLLSFSISVNQVIWTCDSLSSSMRSFLFGTWVIADTADPWSVISGNNALQNWIKNIEAQQVVGGPCVWISGRGYHEVARTPSGGGDVITDFWRKAWPHLGSSLSHFPSKSYSAETAWLLTNSQIYPSTKPKTNNTKALNSASTITYNLKVRY